MNQTPETTVRWAKVIDQTRCIGCHACTTACKSENLVPLGVTRTYVKHVDVGTYPQARRAHQVTRCNQCADAPCVTACPTTAMYKRPDGIVDFDKNICIGCKACIAACPYDAIFINPEDHSAEKCNFCAHRLDVGLEPACVTVCPTEAILIGNLHDPTAKVTQIVNRQPVNVRRPEKETHPKLFYRGAHQSTLDPLAAQRPGGGLFMWSQQKTGAGYVVSGHPDYPNNSAAAILAYDVPHQMPWDWRVSAYTWTKGIAAGAYLVPLLLVVFGFLDAGSPLWLIAAPLVASVFLALTGGLLLWDLEHPERFYLIFTKFQWRSWLVKGAVIITAYAAVLGVHLLAALAGATDIPNYLMWPGAPLAVLTAVYTAYLFAQAKARDMWQNPLLPPHLLIQSVMAGAALLTPLSLRYAPEALTPLLTLLSVASLLHLLCIAGEVTLVHPTAHAHLAVSEMVRGRYSWYFRLGVLLALAGLAAPWLGLAVVPPVLIGLLLYEHSYVQAGQSVPLA